MICLGAYLVFTILCTEYGFRTRKGAVANLAGAWRVQGGLVRIALWVWAWFLLPAPAFTQVRFLFFVCTAACGEITVWLLRRALLADRLERRPQGSPVSHLIPLGAGLLLAAALFAGKHYFAVPEGVAFTVWQARYVLALAAFMAMFAWATLVTVSIVEVVRPGDVAEGSSRSLGAGEIIGVLERLLVYFLVLSGGLGPVGFVIAAKSAARFPQFKESEFAEYFLIGTLSSVGIATLAALLVSAA